MRKTLAIIAAVTVALTALVSPAQADEKYPAGLSVVPENVGPSSCLDREGKSESQLAKCFNVKFGSSSIEEGAGRYLYERRKTATTQGTLTNLSTGKKLPMFPFTTNVPKYSPTVMTTGYPKGLKLPTGKYELTLRSNFPAGSVCNESGWCSPIKEETFTSIFQFNWNYDHLRTYEIYKASATKKVTKAATATAKKTASYTGKASYKATQTASYKYKGKTYKATATHTVSKTKKVTKSASYTAKNIKATKSSTKSVISKKSQADANKMAASSASTAAGKTAQTAATASAKATASKKATENAKKLLTTKVKNKATADAKKMITTKVKNEAKSKAKAKALAAAKKKARK